MRCKVWCVIHPRAVQNAVVNFLPCCVKGGSGTHTIVIQRLPMSLPATLFSFYDIRAGFSTLARHFFAIRVTPLRSLAAVVEPLMLLMNML